MWTPTDELALLYLQNPPLQVSLPATNANTFKFEPYIYFLHLHLYPTHPIDRKDKIKMNIDEWWRHNQSSGQHHNDWDPIGIVVNGGDYQRLNEAFE